MAIYLGISIDEQDPVKNSPNSWYQIRSLFIKTELKRAAALLQGQNATLQMGHSDFQQLNRQRLHMREAGTSGSANQDLVTRHIDSES